MAIIIGLLTAVVLVLVVVGVTTHTEPGLSSEFTALHFERNTPRPIPVCVTGYSSEHDGPEPYQQQPATDEELSAVAHAVQSINDRVGMHLLDSGNPTDSRCVIHVQLGVPYDETWTDPGDHAWPCTTSACCIQTSNTGQVGITGLVIQHGLGHCIGLADDCFNSSIMCGGHCCDMQEGAGLGPRMTDSDRALIRQLYGGN